MTQIAEVIIQLPPITLQPMTFFDRDSAAWTVTEGEFDGQPVLKINVAEEGGPEEQVVFHKDDAPFIIMLIQQAADRE